MDFDLNVPIRTFLDLAIPSSILSKDSRFKSVFYQFHINVFFNVELVKSRKLFRMVHSLDRDAWAELGLLKVQQNSEFACKVKSPADLIEKFIFLVNEGRYVETRLNEFYIPGRPYYKMRQGDAHINVVVGYDKRSSEFLIAGYNKDYEVTPVKWDNFVKAFFEPIPFRFGKDNAQALWSRVYWELSPTFGVRASDADQYYSCCLAQLQHYLNGSDSRYDKRVKCEDRGNYDSGGSWGINSYLEWENYCERVAKADSDIDLRGTRMLWEHKKSMVDRLQVWEAMFSLDLRRVRESICEVERDAKRFRIMSFLYNNTHHVSFPEASSQILQRMAEVEGKALRDIVRSLEAG